MTKHKPSTSPAYAVGYGRPPQATQFKAGQSGNPKGRPKGSRSVGAILQEILGRRVAVTEGDRTRRLPVLHVALLRLGQDAMRGDHKAIKLFLSLLDRYGASPEARLQIQDLLAEDRQILDEYLNRSGTPPAATTAEQNKKEPTDDA